MELLFYPTLLLTELDTQAKFQVYKISCLYYIGHLEYASGCIWQYDLCLYTKIELGAELFST